MSWVVFWLGVISFIGTVVNPVLAMAATVETVVVHDVTFTYEDAGYEQVYLAGSFTDWVRLPLAKDDDQWTVTLQLESGPQYYRFTVADQDETWDAIDPRNPAALNHELHGWISVLDLSDEEDIEPPHRSSRRHSSRPWRYRKQVKAELRFPGPDYSFFSYQRVDGLSLGLDLDHVGLSGTFEPSARGVISYGFSSGRWSGSLTLMQPLIPDRYLRLKLSLYDRTDDNNQTNIGYLENSLAAFFLHEDYRDYYRAKGFSVSVVSQPISWLRLEAGGLADEHSSLSTPSVWSVRKGDFTANPAVDEGSLHCFFARLILGGRDNQIHVLYERSPDSSSDAFTYEQITATARGRLNLGRHAGVDVRLKAGTALSGDLPVQRRYVLGGLGTVRGYAYQSVLTLDPSAPPPAAGDAQPYGGSRMVLGNLEYAFELADWFGMRLFYDAGMAWQDQDAAFRWDDLKTSCGIGFLPCDDDDLRFDIIQKLDDPDSKPVFQFRLGKAF